MSEINYNIPPEFQERYVSLLGDFFEKMTGLSKSFIDTLNPSRAEEQVELFMKMTGVNSLKDKKILEIGSGTGIFQLVCAKKYSADIWGAEPSLLPNQTEEDNVLKISLDILNCNNLPTNKIVNSVGEKLPFHDNSFDFVYSSNVLEHVQNPQSVINEAIRVCKPNGIVQIVSPNYGSYYEGHYNCFYIPYQPKWLFRKYLKYILRKNSSLLYYVDELRTEINYYSVKKWLKPFLKANKIEIITFGEEVCKQRMLTAKFSDWSALGTVKKWLNLIHKLKIAAIVTHFIIKTHTFNPLMITLKKNN